MTGPDYYPEDHEKVDCYDVATPERTRFLAGLAHVADTMTRDQAAHNLTTTQLVMLETARLEGAITVPARHLATARSLADTGLATLDTTTGDTTLTPTAPS